MNENKVDEVSIAFRELNRLMGEYCLSTVTSPALLGNILAAQRHADEVLLKAESKPATVEKPVVFQKKL